MKNKIVIITGSSAGIGKETAYDLLRNEATVIFACRDENKTNKVISSFPIGFQTRSIFIKLDLCSFDSVFKFVEEFLKKFSRLDILINNAGLASSHFLLTEDGIEKTIQSNHLGHMLLTLQLLPYIDKKEGRVINLSSHAHTLTNFNMEQLKNLQNNLDFKDMKFTTMKSSFDEYAYSKLANMFFTSYLKDILDSKYFNIKTASVHPGSVNTEITSAGKGLFHPFLELLIKIFIYPIYWYFSKTSEVGAQTTLYLCYEKHEIIENGEYYADCRRAKRSNVTKDIEFRDEYIKYSWKLIEKVSNGKRDVSSIKNNC